MNLKAIIDLLQQTSLSSIEELTNYSLITSLQANNQTIEATVTILTNISSPFEGLLAH